MRILFRLLLTLSSTSWLIVIFFIKKNCIIAVLFTIIANLVFTKGLLIWLNYLDRDDIKKCVVCELADSDFLPSYIGYFFIAFSIDSYNSMLMTYLLISALVYTTRAEYFNLTFLLFGYHFYHVTIENGIKVFLIVKGGVIKDIRNLQFHNLRRINDVTFITREGSR